MAVARMIVMGLSGATFDLIKPRAAAGELPAFAQLLADGAHAELRDAEPDLSEVLADRVGDVAAAHGKRVGGVQTSETDQIVDAIDRKESDLLWVTFTAHATAQPTVWQHIDGCLAEIARRLDDETGLLVVSGARARAVESYFFLTNWLAETGFLRMKRRVEPAVRETIARTGAEVYALVRGLRRSGLGWLPKLWPQRLATTEPAPKACGAPRASDAPAPHVADAPSPHVDWSATRVYGTSTPGRLCVNLRGRESDGVVPAEQFDSTCEEVRAALLRFRDPESGRHVVRAVHVADDCDLAIETTGPYGAMAGVGAASIVAAGQDDSRGHARPNGMFLLAGLAARRGAGLGEIAARDLAPTLLHLIGVPAPADLGGAVAAAALADGHRADTVQVGRAGTGTHEEVGYQ